MEKEFNLFVQDEQMPLQGKRVIVTGEFGKYSSRSLSAKLKGYGAELCPSATKNVHFAFIGEEASPKVIEGIEKLFHNGFRIPVGGEQSAKKIMNGDTSWLATVPEVKKQLNFTMDHYNNHRVTFESGRNVIASKEIFYGKGFAGDFLLFNQLTGNLGAFGDNICIYPETNICLLSDITLQKLKKGEKDETILYIEDFYNKSDAITFTYSFLSEKDVIDFCEERCLKYDDRSTMEILSKYKMTIKA